MATKLVESLKRLYPEHVSKERLKAMVEKETPTLTPEEFKEITGEAYE